MHNHTEWDLRCIHAAWNRQRHPLIGAAMLIRRGRQSDWPPHPPCPRSSLTLGRARQGPFRRGPARRHRPGRARPEPVQAGPRSAASHVWSFVGARDPSGRRRLSSVSYRTLSAFLGPCTVIPSPAGGPGARAGPTARGAAARARRPPYAVLGQAGGRQAKHRHPAGQAGAGQARTRQGRPAQASRSSSRGRPRTRAFSLHPARGLSPPRSTHIRVTRTLHPGTARRRQAGQAPQSRSQAGKQARRQASSRHAGGAE